MQPCIEQASQQLIAAGQFLFSQGWSPATSSNYSARLDQDTFLITVSGRHKGKLTSADLMSIDAAGKPLDPALRPSAETLLHTGLYAHSQTINCVLHTHSITSTVLSRQLSESQALVLQNYEMLKAFSGVTTHATEISIPIFENTQDIAALAQRVAAHLNNTPTTPAYLIRGHGLYTWGDSVDSALRHVEAMEFLLRCELESLYCRPASVRSEP